MIDSIIEILTDPTQSLAGALLKTQVLASRLDNPELKNWVTNELKGYSDTSLLPEYRKAKANPKADIDDGMNYEVNAPLPVTIFSRRTADLLIKFPIDKGVQSLEQTASGEYGDYLTKQFAEDFSAWLTREAQQNGQRINIHNVRMLIHVSELSQALGEIRTRLLELMLELEKQYPNLEKDIKKDTFDKLHVNQKIIQIMSQVNITTTGDGNLINTGSDNTFTVKTKIIKGDNESLVKALQELKVSEEEIKEIVEITKTDAPDLETKTLGVKTRGWISKMIDKTLDGTWQVATGAAGGLLVELFKYYHGIQ